MNYRCKKARFLESMAAAGRSGEVEEQGERVYCYEIQTVYSLTLQTQILKYRLSIKCSLKRWIMPLIQVKCLSCFPTESWSLFLHVSFTFKSQQWNHLTTILWNLFSLYAFANQIKSSIPFAKYMSFRNNTIIA